MITSIVIDGYRGINRAEFRSCKRVNLLVGKNNSGKTSILEGIRLLSNAADPEQLMEINRFRDIKLDEHAWRLFFHDLNTKRTINISGDVQMLNINEKRELLIKPGTLSKATTTISKAFPVVKDQSHNLDGQIVKLIMQFWWKRENFEQPILIESELIDRGATIDFTGNPSYQEFLNCSYVSQKMTPDIGKKFENIQIKKQKSKVEKILREIEPRLESLFLGAEGTIYCDIGLERLVPIQTMGDGFVKLLDIIIEILDAQDGIVLIDEIENGFHHSSLQILWKAIFEATNEFNVQVFATTHSLECVKAFGKSYRAVQTAKHKNPLDSDELRLYRIEKGNERSRVVTYDTELLLASLESDWEMR